MNQSLSAEALDQLFREARSFSYWQDRLVSDEQLRQLYDLMKWGPTGVNSCPLRIVFVRSPEGKERLLPCLNDGNVRKAQEAPVVAILAADQEFYTQLHRLWPHEPEARSWYEGKSEKIESVSRLSGTLQGGYFIIAARALGLDCGPMSGFNYPKLEAEFFPEGKHKALFVCALGYGQRERLYPRGPRLDFDEVCTLL